MSRPTRAVWRWELLAMQPRSLPKESVHSATSGDRPKGLRDDTRLSSESKLVDMTVSIATATQAAVVVLS